MSDLTCYDCWYDSYLISDLATELIQYPTPGCVQLTLLICHCRLLYFVNLLINMEKLKAFCISLFAPRFKEVKVATLTTRQAVRGQDQLFRHLIPRLGNRSESLVITVNCSCIGKLFSHFLQSLMPIRILCMRMGTRLCKEWENFPMQLQFTVSMSDYQRLLSLGISRTLGGI